MMDYTYDKSAFLQKADSSRSSFVPDGISSYRLKVVDAPKSTIGNELKRIRAENPNLYKALSLDKFD